jgi:PKD repeat protein
MKTKIIIKSLFIFIFSIFILNSTALAYFEQVDISSPTIMKVLGNFTINGEDAEVGDEIAAIDNDGLTINVYVVEAGKEGTFQLTKLKGDQSNTDVDEGFENFENIQLWVYDKSEDYPFPLDASMLTANADVHQGIKTSQPMVMTSIVFFPGNDFFGLNVAATYTPPELEIESFLPTQSLTTGGDILTITGTNFKENLTIQIGENESESVTVVSKTLVKCKIPASDSPGMVSIIMTNPTGDSVTQTNAFEYILPSPQIDSIFPTEVNLSGGTSITITGQNFEENLTLTVDNQTIAPTNISINQILFVAPALSNAGSVSIVITNPDGKSTSDNLTYVYDPPSITQITPAEVTTDGLTVTITGNYFRQNATATVDGSPASLKYISQTTIQCYIPPYTNANYLDTDVPIIVQNTDGKQDESTLKYVFIPKIDSITPQIVSIAGGEKLTITGNNFQTNATVWIDNNQADNVSIVSFTQITCDIPENEDAGVVDVLVKNPNDTTATTQITYETPTPTISEIYPENLYTSGGIVTITGTYFQDGLTVSIDGITVTNSHRISSQSLTCTAPPHDVGQVELLLTNPDGKSTTQTLNYVYHQPTITVISPQTGSTEGAEAMTITGNYFRQGATVNIGGIAATVQSIITPTTIICDIPAYTEAGAVDVQVVNDDDQEAVLENAFTYLVYPKIQDIDPLQSLTTGGETLQITGTHFMENISVSMNGNTITPVNRISDTQISFVIPEHAAGEVNIVVTNTDKGFDSITFTYISPAPTITQISPENIYISGGQTLTITGTSFEEGLTVTIDGIDASDATWGSSTSLTCTSLPHPAGEAVLEIINPDGKSVTKTFIYENNPPEISDITPQKGSSEGNEILTITGNYFDLSATVQINNENAEISTISTQTIECVIPPYTDVTCTDATVNVVVQNTDGKQDAETFQYVFIPKIETISPSIVDITGGGKLTISGTNFQENATVLIGNSEPNNVSIVSRTQITCDIPANDVGQVNVVVTNPNTYSSTSILTYEFPAPTISEISPSRVYNTGGQELTIVGTNFDLTATVTIDGNTIPSNRESYTTITCIAPQHDIPSNKTISVVDVVVTNPNGKSSSKSTLIYEFNPPTITDISPATGSTESLTFTIMGEHFREGATVKAGEYGEFKGYVIQVTNNTIQCNLLNYDAPELIISVANDDGKTSETNTFELKFLPAIENITPQIIYTHPPVQPDSLPMTITGAHFEVGLTVTIAGNMIKPYSVTDTKIMLYAPVINAYTKTDVTVINPNETQMTKMSALEYRDVIARFAITPQTTGKVPYSVQFEDQSIGNVTNIKKWIWQYADGKTKIKNSNTYSYVYNEPGDYQTKLSIVVSSNGNVYTETAAIQTVTVNPADIVLAFGTLDGKEGYPPFKIRLNNQTSSADSLDITWTWDFGDGTTSTDKSPVHTYTQSGSYTITLRAEINEEIKTLLKADYISVIEPKIDNRLTGQVSYDNGLKLPENTWVHVWSPETGEGESAPVDENGNYTILDLNPDSEYIISVDFKFGQAYYNETTTVFSNSHAAAVTPSDGYNITLPSQFYSASGKIIFDNGQPVSNIMIEAFSEDTGYWTFAMSTSRFVNNANYKLNELVAGVYSINVISEKYTLKGDTSSITISVDADNSAVIIPDLILQKELKSISGRITGVENQTMIWISAFSQAVNAAKAISLTVSDSVEYTLNDLKPSDDYVVQLHAQDYPDLYYNSKSSWFEADFVVITDTNATGIDFTLTSYDRSISGMITVPDDAQSGEIIWIDAFSDSLDINSATMITVDDQCDAIGECDYPYTINGLEAGDDYIVIVNSDKYETLFYDNEERMGDATLIDLTAGNEINVNFELTEGYYIDGTIEKPESLDYSDIEVEVWSNDSNSWGFAIPDENGAFLIEGLSQASDFVVQAFIEDEPPYIYKEGSKHTRDISAATPVASVQGGETSVNIEVVTGNTLSGTVMDQAGESLSNVMVIVENQTENIAIVTRTNSYGTYAIMGLPGNISYSVTADPGASSKFRPMTKTIQSYDFTQDSIINFELASGLSVLGTVKFEETNIDGADIFLRSPATGFDRWTLSKSGQFSIKGVPSGNYELIVETDQNFRREIKTISVTSDVSIDITLTQAAGKISGTVYNDKNETLPNVTIHVYSVKEDFQRFDILTNYKGAYEVNGLPLSDDYVVTAIPATYTYAKETKFDKSPENTVDFTLTTGGSINGTVQASDGTKLESVLITLNSSSLNIENEMTRTDSNGNYTFDALMNSNVNDYIVSAYPVDYPEPDPVTGLNIGDTANFTLTKGTGTTISGTLGNTGSKQIKVNVYNFNTYQMAGSTLAASDGSFQINSLEAELDYVLQFVSKDGSVNHFLANDLKSMTTGFDGTSVQTSTELTEVILVP